MNVMYMVNVVDFLHLIYYMLHDYNHHHIELIYVGLYVLIDVDVDDHVVVVIVLLVFFLILFYSLFVLLVTLFIFNYVSNYSFTNYKQIVSVSVVMLLKQLKKK
eukprot:756858_1